MEIYPFEQRCEASRLGAVRGLDSVAAVELTLTSATKIIVDAMGIKTHSFLAMSCRDDSVDRVGFLPIMCRAIALRRLFGRGFVIAEIKSIKSMR